MSDLHCTPKFAITCDYYALRMSQHLQKKCSKSWWLIWILNVNIPRLRAFLNECEPLLLVCSSLLLVLPKLLLRWWLFPSHSGVQRSIVTYAGPARYESRTNILIRHCKSFLDGVSNFSTLERNSSHIFRDHKSRFAKTMQFRLSLVIFINWLPSGQNEKKLSRREIWTSFIVQMKTKPQKSLIFSGLFNVYLVM